MEFIAELGLWLITPLFKLCAFAFKIFMILAQSDVLREVQYGKLLTNFYIILGLVMLFIMAFALLRGIVNPDDQKQGTTVVKNVIVNFVISCVMLGFLPTVFPFLFDVQDSILRYNVIGGFFGYGYTGGQEIENPTNSTNEVEASAYRLVNGIFTAFFNVSDDYCKNFLSEGETSGDSGKVYEGKSTELVACQESLASGKNISDNGKTYKDSFLAYKLYVDATGQFGVYNAFSSQAAEGSIEFNFLALLIAGLLLIYVGVSYCFDMGLRLIKLIFYQLIAPIPIFLRVVPNNKISGTFNQWLKVTLTCWMEVFVRIFIFCFCTWLCSALLSTDFLTVDVLEYGKLTGLVTQAFILMAVVMFMKRSPKLISEITGIDSGNMKLGLKDKFKEVTSAVGSLPLVGTALRGTGTLGKKLISGWDAHRSGYKFSDGWNRIEGNGPYAKYKKWRDNFLPYSASNAESRKKAEEQVSEIEKKEKRGKNFADRLQKDLTEAYKNGNLDLLDKVLEIKDAEGNKISVKDARVTPEMIQDAINNAGAGEFIKHLAATSNDRDFQALGKTYNERSIAKGKMLEAKAEMEKVMNDQHSTVAERQAASKKYSELNDSYEAIDNEWKQRLITLNNRKEISGYNAMKFREDRGKALPKDNSYQATRNENSNNQDSDSVIPPSIGGNSQTSVPPSNVSSSNGPIIDSTDKDKILDRLNELQRQDFDNYRKNLDQQWRNAQTKEEKDRIYKEIEEFNKRHGN